jgi:hypothetical protein
MSRESLLELVKSDYTKLVPVLALAFYMAFIPHLNYPYAVHIDEWVHIAHSNSLLNTGTIFYPDPFTGTGSSGLVGLLELGYHLPFAVFHRISGISWMDISMYAPSITFVFTVLSVYIFAKRFGFGWEAAFFTCLIPTTVGIMGPALMVPVAMALMFTAIVLNVAFSSRTFWSYLVICLLICFLVILHATSAVIVIMLLVPFIILRMKGEFKRSLFVILAIAVPFLVTLPWTYDLIASQAGSLFTQKPLPAYHDFLKIITGYGYIPIIFCLIGTFVLTAGGDWKNYSLVGGLLIVVAMLAIFYTLHYGVSLVYLRGLIFAMLIIGIVAGAGLMALRKLELPWLPATRVDKPPIVRAVGISLCLIVLGITLYIAIPDRLDEGYYHMIDEEDYEAFVWIRDHVGSNNTKAILDPWKATSFTAITEKYVYTRTHVSRTDKDNEAYDFIRNGSADTSLLEKNDITIVYTRVYDGINNAEFIPDNPDLVEVRKNVYLLKDAGSS